jgi:hypothetical protein
MPACYRGVVGVVKPTRSAGSIEEMIRLLPDGVGVIPLFLNVREQDLGLPVVHPVPARVWAIQDRLGINQPVMGAGQLLATLP